MKYLITGANGQLGNALKKVLPKEECLFTDVDELDVTDREAITNIIRENKPDYILHCAALTNVDGCETNEELADKINHLSVEYFSEACNKVGATLFYISTDYVFDGEARDPYAINFETNPRSIYGKTKLTGEVEAKKTKKYYIFRTSWVYGEGNNFVRTMLKLSETMDEVKVVGDQFGRPTYALDLAHGMVEALNKKIPFGTYHFQNSGEPISWAEFATEIFKITGKKTKVTPISTAEYLKMNTGKQVAPRPKYSVLDITDLEKEGIDLPAWRQSLEPYLDKEINK